MTDVSTPLLVSSVGCDADAKALGYEDVSSGVEALVTMCHHSQPSKKSNQRKILAEKETLKEIRNKATVKKRD